MNSDETTSNQRSLSLAKALGLRPLDRVQISSKHEIAEANAFSRFYDSQSEWPFFYFQRVVGDQLEVRSPGGYATLVSPHDICDILPGTPVIVQSLTPDAFMRRLKLSWKELQVPAGPECYAPANVLYATKNQWNMVEMYVWFIDGAANGQRPWKAKIRNPERSRVERMARRTVMPVSSRSGGNHSADHGKAHAEAYDQRVASLLIGASLGDRLDDVSAIASAGIRRVTLASLNKRFDRPKPACQFHPNAHEAAKPITRKARSTALF